MKCELEDKIFSIGERDFDALALDVFRFQYENNNIYRRFVSELGIEVESVRSLREIPHMPIQFFKTGSVKTGDFEPEIVFESSGTTHTGNSRHEVKTMNLYRDSFLKAFRIFYGAPQSWHILGFLPSYLERQHSSLIAMVDELIKLSGHPESGFYLENTAALQDRIRENEKNQQPTLLIGVTYALLDLADIFSFPLKHTVVMETGGMKGRRKEMTRQEVHEALTAAWRLPSVHSEYGMTELLSQAYSSGEGIFRCPPWMSISLREEDDPLTIKHPAGDAGFIDGIINVADLANLYSCAFIATDDIGRLFSDRSFSVMGRMDSSDVRGCNLMYA